MISRKITYKMLTNIICCILCIGVSASARTQTPVVTVRFANPVLNVNNDQYCVDVEFLSDIVGTQIFGMNVRFFYDESVLAFEGFTDFTDGYDVVEPSPPQMITSAAGPLLFNFAGPAVFVNGAIQLTDPTATPVFLDPALWTKIFQVCFDVVDPDVQSFCPALIWDMEQDPADGGYVVGDDGVIVTCIDPDPLLETQYSIVNVEQFNWIYIGSGTYPFGQPQSNVCISLNEPLVLTPPQNITVEFGQALDPSVTGYANASDICNGDPLITFSDVIVAGPCPGEFQILRTWMASNECNPPGYSLQSISVHDTTAPVITGVPDDTKIICEQLPGIPVIYAEDLSAPVSIEFSESISKGDGSGEFNVIRQWVCTDACGNSSMEEQHIYWKPGAIITSEIILPSSMECNTDKVIISSSVVGELTGVTYNWEVTGGKSFLQAGQGTPEINIHVGGSLTDVTLTLTDPNGCVTTSSVQFDCNSYNDKRGYVGALQVNVPESSAFQRVTDNVQIDNKSMVPDKTQWNVWPNPANENLHLGFESYENKEAQITILNFLGQRVWNNQIDTHAGYTTHDVDVSQMIEGKYLVRVKSGEVTYSKVMVILHRK